MNISGTGETPTPHRKTSRSSPQHPIACNESSLALGVRAPEFSPPALLVNLHCLALWALESQLEETWSGALNVGPDSSPEPVVEWGLEPRTLESRFAELTGCRDAWSEWGTNTGTGRLSLASCGICRCLVFAMPLRGSLGELCDRCVPGAFPHLPSKLIC